MRFSFKVNLKLNLDSADVVLKWSNPWGYHDACFSTVATNHGHKEGDNRFHSAIGGVTYVPGSTSILRLLS